MRQSQLPVVGLHVRFDGHCAMQAVLTYPQLSLQLAIEPEHPAAHVHAPVDGMHVSPEGHAVHRPPHPSLMPQLRPDGQLGVHVH